MKDKESFRVMKAVYTYFFPEVRPLVKSTANLDHELFLTSTPIEKAQEIIDTLNFRKRIIVPSTLERKVNLDEVHKPIIDRIVEIYGETILGLDKFNYRYPTAGSSEGIFHSLAQLKANGVNKIYTFKGEYEGYKEYGKTLGIETIDINPELTDISKLERGVWYISNPSAINGNITPNQEINNLCDNGHKVILDLAYVGSTRKYLFDVSHPNISTVFLSFSKPYGVFRFRIGFTFSRQPIQSLYANKWFKDVERVLSAAKIAEEIGPNRLYNKYQPIKENIIKNINRNFELSLRSSDSLLLAYLTEKDARNLDEMQKELIEPYRRGEYFRFCLTPYFEELENGGTIS